jgi:hypothetical protein
MHYQINRKQWWQSSVVTVVTVGSGDSGDSACGDRWWQWWQWWQWWHRWQWSQRWQWQHCDSGDNGECWQCWHSGDSGDSGDSGEMTVITVVTVVTWTKRMESRAEIKPKHINSPIYHTVCFCYRVLGNSIERGNILELKSREGGSCFSTPDPTHTRVAQN